MEMPLRLSSIRVRLIGSGALLWLATAGCSPADLDTAELRSLGLSSGDVVEGQLEILVADDFAGGESWLIHRVVVDGQPVELQFDGEPPELAPRSLVQVWGHDGYETFEVDGIDVVSPPPQPLIDADPYAPRRLAVVLLDWGSGPEVTAAEADEKMWSADYASHKYWAEISYGKEALEGEIFGPFTMNYPGCNTDTIAWESRQRIVGDGGNPDDFDQFLYVFPSAGCGWGGLAMLGSPNNPAEDSWYNGSFGCVVRNQEVAHNYGLMHTHLYQCGDVPFGSNCGSQEYGSPYDPMGQGCGHMAAPDKEFMGWLEECNVVDANISGSFNLLPSELPCNGTQALRVPTYDGRKYWLEYRLPVGFDEDEETEGVLVHVSEPGNSWGPEAYLIDLGVGGFLREGESYSDPQGGVTFMVREEHDTHAVIDIIFQGGGSGSPACLGGETPMMVGGAYGTLECMGGPFEPDGEPPTVAIASPSDGSFFADGESFDVTVNADDASGVYSVSLYLDGTLSATLTEPPWAWQINNLPLGSHTFVAKASDGVLEGESAEVRVEINEDGADGGDDSPGGGGPNGDDGGSDGGGGGGSDDDGDGPDSPDNNALPPGFGLNGGEQGCSIHGGAERPISALLLLLWVGFGWRRNRAVRSR